MRAWTTQVASMVRANLICSRYALIEPDTSKDQSEIVALLLPGAARLDKTTKISRIDVQVNQSIESLAEYRSALITAAVTGQLADLR